MNIFVNLTSRLRDKWHIFCTYKFAYLKKSPCLFLIYSSSDLSKSSEENFKLSVIYLSTFFLFQCINIPLKTPADYSFHLFYEQNQLTYYWTRIIKVYFRHFFIVKICSILNRKILFWFSEIFYCRCVRNQVFLNALTGFIPITIIFF